MVPPPDSYDKGKGKGKNKGAGKDNSGKSPENKEVSEKADYEQVLRNYRAPKRNPGEENHAYRLRKQNARQEFLKKLQIPPVAQIQNVMVTSMESETAQTIRTRDKDFMVRQEKRLNVRHQTPDPQNTAARKSFGCVKRSRTESIRALALR